jgi:hypothetical protein
MTRHALRTFLTASITALLVAVLTAPASAQTTGRESFHGFLLTSGASGERVVLASPIVASGVFTGVGRIVEVESLPGDPNNVSRDDLVFRQGTFHLVNENGDVSFSLNPATCKFTVTIEQTGTIDGGTGAFSNASGSFTGSVHAFGLAARNPDGSCNEAVAPLRELDVVAGTGSLTF